MIAKDLSNFLLDEGRLLEFHSLGLLAEHGLNARQAVCVARDPAQQSIHKPGYMGALVLNYLSRADAETRAALGEVPVSAYLFSQAINLGLADLLKIKKETAPVVTIGDASEGDGDLCIAIQDLHYITHPGSESASLSQLANWFYLTKNPYVMKHLLQKGKELATIVAGRSYKKYSSHLEFRELFCAANVGLYDAIHKWNPHNSNGATFETYATMRMFGEIGDDLRERAFDSRAARKTLRLLNQFSERYQSLHGRMPSVEELNAYCLANGCTEDEFKEAYPRLHQPSIFISLSSTVRTRESHTRELTVEERLDHKSNGSNPLTSLMSKELFSIFYRDLQGVPSERDRQIIADYVFEGTSEKDLGSLYGLSESRVCQIVQNTFRHGPHFRRTREYLKQEHPIFLSIPE